MYRTLIKADGGYRHAICPECGQETEVADDAAMRVIITCNHFARRWRVAADQRIRVEFRPDTTVVDAE